MLSLTLANRRTGRSSRRGLYMPAAKPPRGVTLIELLIAMVVISIALASLLRVVGQSATRSSDPARRYQALVIAQSYLDEALAAPYRTNEVPNCVLGSPEPRSLFDDLCDYDGINETPRDRLGNVIAGLDDFNVVVDIDNVNAQLGAIVAPDVAQVTVTVRYLGTVSELVQLTGYKTCVAC